MNSYIKPIHKILSGNRDREKAAPMKKYMRDQFGFFGIQATERRALCKEYMNSVPLPDKRELHGIVKELWSMPERDFQYFGIELLIKCRKFWTAGDDRFWEFLITHKSWWDSVDYLANKVTGPWFRRFPEKIKPVTGRWNQSENIWLQRMSILFQLKYKKDTDLKLLFKYIQNLSHSKEFFVQKAIGWSLREYTKTDPAPILKFLEETTLAPLSRREALKIINKQLLLPNKNT